MTGCKWSFSLVRYLGETACSLWPATYHTPCFKLPNFQASILLPPSVVVSPLPIAGAGGSQKARPCLIDLVGCFGARPRLWPGGCSLLLFHSFFPLSQGSLPRTTTSPRPKYPKHPGPGPGPGPGHLSATVHSQRHGVVDPTHPPVHRRCPAGVRSGQPLSPARALIRSPTTPVLAHLISSPSTVNHQPSTINASRTQTNRSGHVAAYTPARVRCRCRCVCANCTAVMPSLASTAKPN